MAVALLALSANWVRYCWTTSPVVGMKFANRKLVIWSRHCAKRESR